MSPVEWYYARENRQMGPVSPAELKRLAAAGELGPDDLVWREGMTEWSAAKNVRGLFEEEGRGAASENAGQPALKGGDSGLKVGPSALPPHRASAAVPARHPLDVLLDKVRPHFDASFIETTGRVFRACGSYGLLVAAGLAAAFALITAVKTGPIDHLLYGVVWVLVLVALQYVAGKSFGAIEPLHRAVGATLSSSVLPDCLALLSKVAGVAALLGSVVFAVNSSQYFVILGGVAMFLVCAYLAVIALNLAAMNVSIAPEALPGEEALGVFMFLVKALLRLTPVAFGAGVACGTLLLGLACFQAFGGGPVTDNLGRVMLSESGAMAAAARHALISAAVLPLAAYLLFLLGNLLVNLLRSILSLPPKLDRLAEKRVEAENRP